MKILTFFFLLFVNAINASEEQVFCERIAGYHVEVPDGTQRTCFMSNTTSIDSHGVVLGSEKDETIKWISFSLNKKIEYLPVQVSVKFPSLTCYMAYRCSIKAISRDNFREMTQLTLLYLYSNQIEEIKRDTFLDLKKLSVLLLGE
jgi:Leucine rich repeat